MGLGMPGGGLRDSGEYCRDLLSVNPTIFPPALCADSSGEAGRPCPRRCAGGRPLAVARLLAMEDESSRGGLRRLVVATEGAA